MSQLRNEGCITKDAILSGKKRTCRGTRLDSTYIHDAQLLEQCEIRSLKLGWFYSDLSLPHAPRSCQNVELSGLQVEVILWLCSAHFVSVKKKTGFCPKSLAMRD